MRCRFGAAEVEVEDRNAEPPPRRIDVDASSGVQFGHHDQFDRQPVGELTIGVTAEPLPDVRVGIKVLDGDPHAVFDVLVLNTGNTRVESVCVLDAAPPLPGEPRPDAVRFEAVPGGHADVRFVRPRAGHWPRRNPALRPYALLHDRWVAGPPVVAARGGFSGRQIGAAAAAVLVAAALFIPLLRDDATAGPQPAGAVAATDGGADEGSTSAPAGAVTILNRVDPLPVDALFDAPGDARRPVLVSRDGTASRLPAGGPVEIAVKVPTGWILRRATAGGKEVQYVHGVTVTPLARGDKVRFAVDGPGERIVVDNRPSTDVQGALVVRDLTGAAVRQTEVRAGVAVAAWVGKGVLLNDADGALDYWWPDKPSYHPTPGRGHGSYLGRIDDARIAVYEPKCLVALGVDWPFAEVQRQCGTTPAPAAGSFVGGWTSLSPTGTVAMRGSDGALYLGAATDFLARRAIAPVPNAPAAVDDVEWADGSTAALLAGGRLWTCRDTCTPSPLPPGLRLSALAALS